MKLCANPKCRRPIDGQRPTESASSFERRTHCSHKCAIATRKERMWANRPGRRRAGSSKIPAPTVEEWLLLNGGPTMCPTMYASPIEHPTAASYSNGNARRGR